jgi:choline dehydrogenase-like flavoprotein
MAKITVVGSGASAVHFALSVLKKGHHVTMLDVGFRAPEQVNPEDTFTRLKCSLKDPANYFLGKNFEGVIPPDCDKEFYGFPPNKQYIFTIPEEFKEESRGFEPLFSFAEGGLAQAWTGGAYPFDDADMRDFPFNYDDIKPYYEEVARRIGIIGIDDDLSTFFPLHKHLLPPLDLDEHSQLLITKYEEKKEQLKEKLGVHMGRNRMAVLSQDLDGRKACDYSGRCIWGCPTDSLYVPSITLDQCKDFPKFEYLPQSLVTHFKYTSTNRITHITVFSLESQKEIEYPVTTLVLAAGALSSTKIYLESILQKTGELVELHGLMDNRQILVPFVNLDMIGKPFDPKSYQYHQLALGLPLHEPWGYVHGQITTLKTAQIQPVLQSMPLDWKTATFLGRNLHSALGVINVNFCDTRRQGNYVTLQPQKNHQSTLRIFYSPPADEKKKVSFTLKKIKKFLGKLGCIAPPGQTHIRPMGASVHYSGTIPFSKDQKPHSLSPNCQSHDFENLYFVDGTSFPYLPAKNLTFTLMANAARVADLEF